jgi:hypothetical protein
MPDLLTRFLRYRQWAIEYRTRAAMAGDDRQRAEYVKLAIRYEEIADAAMRVNGAFHDKEPCLFGCPVTGAEVHGFIAEETFGNDVNSYDFVNCLDCGQIHLVDFSANADRESLVMLSHQETDGA